MRVHARARPLGRSIHASHLLPACPPAHACAVQIIEEATEKSMRRDAGAGGRYNIM